MAKIDILLATYNGQKHIKAQVFSLLGQSFNDWNLIVHDDGSTDATLAIIKELMSLDSRIELIEDNLRFGSAALNFMHLLNHSTADYYMFCDQDDIWLPFKIEKTLEKMHSIESANRGKAIVVNTDLTVVDNELNVIAPSFWKYSGINPDLLVNFNYLCVYNFVTGCTMMINGKAREIVFPFPDEAIMHDSWIALKVLSQGGVLGYVEAPSVHYRQHSSNVVGAEKINKLYFLKKMTRISQLMNENKRQLRMVNKVKKLSVVTYLKYKLLYYLKR